MTNLPTKLHKLIQLPPSFFKTTILFQDSHLLLLHKPTNLLVHSSEINPSPNLLDQAKQYIKERSGKLGAVYLSPVHRIDLKVSGVVVFCKTSKSARRMSEKFKVHTNSSTVNTIATTTNTNTKNKGKLNNKTALDITSNNNEPNDLPLINGIEKTYLCWVEGIPQSKTGHLKNELKSNPTSKTQLSTLDYRVIKTNEHSPPSSSFAVIPASSRKRFSPWGYKGDSSLLAITLGTGRNHQIRKQLSIFGFPIIGDTKYGATDFSLRGGEKGIALHAWRVRFFHPVAVDGMNELVDVRARPGKEFGVGIDFRDDKD